MPDLETRSLEYFVAVAEELHYARAARRLHIVQPALSRAIQRLESRLGVQLLVRDSRQVALTPAGEALLHHARQVLAAVERATSSTRAAGRTARTLRLVVKPGGDNNLIPAMVAAWKQHPEAADVEIVFGGLTDRVQHLLDRRADLGILYDPFDDLTGLDCLELMVERRVAVLPASHRLAGRQELRMSDLDGETMARWKGMPADRDGPEISSMAELALLVALGQAVTVLPASTVGLLSADAVTVPVTDAPPNRTVIAWRRDSGSAEIAAFARSAAHAARRRLMTPAD